MLRSKQAATNLQSIDPSIIASPLPTVLITHLGQRAPLYQLCRRRSGFGYVSKRARVRTRYCAVRIQSTRNLAEHRVMMNHWAGWLDLLKRTHDGCTTTHLLRLRSFGRKKTFCNGGLL